MFESESAADVIDRMCAASRAENRAAGERLVAIGELDVLRLRERGECETYCTDTWDAVTAEVAAALQISQGLAASYVESARILRNRLPRVGAALVAGDITFWTFQTIAYRTELITDTEVMASVDAELAAKVRRWASMTRGRLVACIDRVVERMDRDAVRRRRKAKEDRKLSISDSGNGLSDIFGRLVSTDAHAVDKRLDALADTVCADDPRTRMQRRADAMGALAVGAERLACRCGLPACPAGATSAPPAVVIHVVAEQATVEGAAQTPGFVVGTEELFPAELVAELAASAKLAPLIHPTDASPERGYTPSRGLAEFIRCRDLTCRFPGCDRSALNCDLDHTVPHDQGGATHASNLKCLCRQHHLIKTFWGWRDKQLPDGTVIWTSPSAHTYVTTPGSALLFPSLCVPTGDLPAPEQAGRQRCADKTATMPLRTSTRAQNRARYVKAERRLNRQSRQNYYSATQVTSQVTTQGDPGDDDPPPF
ncbi:HNH endonuclease signature motif containing protein [Mycobacterium sp.]|uniref:HNH endonuclease signature motif containing protein n=1 Tax=Mycobacterium sp. TaxID=1785 RepID=UPI0025E0E1FA|nr:HNH endonuclease signature motif containing protein [Mycobacterium sp.]